MRRLIPAALSRLSSRAGNPDRPAPRRNPTPLGRRLRRSAPLFGLLGALGGGAGWLWASGMAAQMAEDAEAKALAMSVRGGFAVSEVLVSGRLRTDKDTLREAVGVERGDPIVLFDPAGAKDRIESLGWVRAARVERRLPDLVFVSVVEREPLAIWQHDAGFSLIDGEGAVIGDVTPAFAHLPVVVGQGAPEAVAALLTMLHETAPDLASRVRAAVRVGERRWNLRLDHVDNGVELRLPEEAEAREAWRRLARLHREHRLLDRDVTMIDLRMDDRMIVRLSRDGERDARPEPAPPPPAFPRGPGTDA